MAVLEVRIESDNAHPNDPSRVNVGDKRGVHKAFLRAHIRNVGHPQFIRALKL